MKAKLKTAIKAAAVAFVGALVGGAVAPETIQSILGNIQGILAAVGF